MSRPFPASAKSKSTASAFARLCHAAFAIFALQLAAVIASVTAADAATYAWMSGDGGTAVRSTAPGDVTLASRIPPPPGFTRTPAAAGSFASWLRGLPMKPDGAPVLLHTGVKKMRQDVHTAVVDIDTGPRDLQQCADAIMRLRAEWLWSSGRRNEIGFNYTDGRRRSFSSTGKSDYRAFRKYMDLVFAYAGTYSLERELKPVAAADIAIGDVFIKGGFPGHAVLVADMAVDATGQKRFLLLQSYMPAQEIHVLKNPAAGAERGTATATGSPWYETPLSYPFVTPEWTFPDQSLKRWP